MAFGDPSGSARVGFPPDVASTEKWLTLDGVPAGRWRLPDDTNLDLLEAHIKAAMRSGDVFTVEVQTDSGSCASRILLNGKALPYVVLSETDGVSRRGSPF